MKPSYDALTDTELLSLLQDRDERASQDPFLDNASEVRSRLRANRDMLANGEAPESLWK